MLGVISYDPLRKVIFPVEIYNSIKPAGSFSSLQTLELTTIINQDNDLIFVLASSGSSQ